MAATDTLRGGARHELAVELGAIRALDDEGEVRTGEPYRFQGAWGCTHGSPVAGGADSTRDRTGVTSDD